MLKRQRPSSPAPPSSSSVPLVSDAPGDLIAIEQPQSKRRRTAPPTLDGPARGWATSKRSAHGCGWVRDYEDDDDAEDEYHSDEQGDDPEGVPSSTSFEDHLDPHASEYKSTNNMLRELHTLHQHRLLFSPAVNHHSLNNNSGPSSLTSSTFSECHGNTSNNSRLYSQNFQNTLLSKDGIVPQLEKSRISLLPQLPLPGPHSSMTSSSFVDKGSLSTPTPHQTVQQHQILDKLSEESTSVSERYESTNRLIGSWFLSRRRALDTMDEASGSRL